MPEQLLKFHLDGDKAFVEVGKDNYMCVGEKEEIYNKTVDELGRLVLNAHAHAEFYAICRGVPKHTH